MDQVVRRVGFAERSCERLHIEHVARDDLDLRAPGFGVELVRGAGQASHVMAARDELGDQPATDVARRARHHDAPTMTVHARPARRRNDATNRSGSASVRVIPG